MAPPASSLRRVRPGPALGLLILSFACSDPIGVVQGPPGPAGEVPALEGALQVTALDEAGAPLRGASAVTWPLGLTATSGEDGTARLDGLPTGSYRVTVAAAGRGEVVFDAVPIATGTTTELEASLLPEDEAQATPALRVTVLRASGGPLAGATVDLDGGAFSAVTGEDGVAEFETLAAGEYDVLVTPADDSPAMPRTTPGVAVAGPDTTELEVRCSGRPPQDATWIGSEGCATCHTGQGRSHARSAHAAAASDRPVPGLDAAFAAGEDTSFEAPDGTLVLVTLLRDESGDHVVIETPAADRTLPVVGYYGGSRTAQVPMLDLGEGVGAAPAPIAWRVAGRGFSAPPAFQPGLIPFEPEVWIGAGGSLVTDALTGGPAPEHLEAVACLGCHAVGYELKAQGLLVTALASDGLSGRAVQLGVGCEACHGPGSAHGDAAFAERADLILQPGLLDRDRVDAICAQCHSRGVAPFFLTSPSYPYASGRAHRPDDPLEGHLLPAPETWPGGTPAAPNQQSDAFAGSGHADNAVYGLHCDDCHDPHGPQPDGTGGAWPAQLVENPDDNSLCQSCHQALHFANADAVQDHTAHSGYGPGQPLASGRCTGCHMPRTASRFGVSSWTGAGELSSHAFAIVQPQEALDVFAAEGVSTLDPNLLPANSCLTCHQWAAELLLQQGTNFWGPFGDPAEQSTYQALQAGYDNKFGSR